MTEQEIQLDFERQQRIGFNEAVLSAGKSRLQIDTILGQLADRNESCLLTRLEPAAFAAIDDDHRRRIDYDAESRTAFFNWQAQTGDQDAFVAIVTAGSSDAPVAREALRTLEFYGIACLSIFDVGVAGLWRLLRRIEELRQFPVLIAVAGMDGALPSVLGGLVPGLVIAVPTSTGYGAANAGQTALNAALASCASGIVAVNIDNGFGAACAALRLVRARNFGKRSP